MKEEESLQVTDLSTFMPPRPKSYATVVAPAERLGKVATSTFRDLKNLLNQEVRMPRPDKIFEKFPVKYRPHPRSIPVFNDELRRLKALLKNSNQVLARARAVFPMQLFPDRVVLDRMKITITKRDILSSDIISIQIEDILNASATIGPLFGSLTIASRVMSSVDHFQINYLWRKDAIQLKHMIQGYVIAKNNNIDTAKLSRKELVEVIGKLGHDTGR